MFSQSIYAASAVRKEQIAALRILADGRKFRYCYNGAVALITGVPIASPDVVANHIGLAVVANTAVGSVTLNVTVGATAVTANQYAGGFVQINAGAGIGQQMKIDSHPANAGSLAMLLQLAEPVRVALTSAASKASLITPDGNLVVVSATSAETPSGVTVCAVPINYYFWSQTGGDGCCAITGTPAVSSLLSNGAAELAILGTDTAHSQPIVAQNTRTVGVDAEAGPIRLLLD
jgi:hypothetical protein